MKSTYLLGALACGLRVEARQIPAAKLAARQWGEGPGGGFGGGWGGWPGGGGGGSGGGSGGSGDSGEEEEQTPCVWTDHCLGDPCETEIDCDGDLYCAAGRCANPPPTVTGGGPTGGNVITTTVYVTVAPTVSSSPGCVWTGHCAGDPCETEIDCDGDLACNAGRCGAPVASVPVVTSTRRIITSTRRIITSTRRVTLTYPPFPFPTRTTVRPQPTTIRRPSNPSCGDNPLACIGASCEADADCGFALIVCNDGVCGL